MPYNPDKYYYALNKLENQYARAVKQAHAMAIKDVYNYLDRQKEALSPQDISYVLSAFGIVQKNLKPIVGQYALKSFQLGNTRVSNLLSRGEQIPYNKQSLRSILDRNYDWVQKYGRDREQILKNELQEALASDYSVTKLKREIQKEFKTTSWRAETIARSETQKTYNQSSRLAIKNSAVTDEYQWETSHLESVCPICRPLDGRVYNVNDRNAPMPVESTHPNCLTSYFEKIFTSKGWQNIGDVKIGDLVLTKERKFRKVLNIFRNGIAREAIAIQIQDRELRLTRKHPVFTDKGYVNSEDLCVGDKVAVLANHDDEYEFMFVPIDNISVYKPKKSMSLYNIEVEEFNNYIAKGLVVHNCNCRIRPHWEEAST